MMAKEICEFLNHVFWEIKWMIFFSRGFLLRAVTIRRTAGEEREAIVISLYNFHLLTSIQAFICNTAYEMH